MRRSIFTAVLLSLVLVCPGKEEIKTFEDHGKVKTYGDASIKNIVKLADGYSFVCDIEGWPAIIGENIPVRIDGIIPPEIVEDGGKPNKYFQKKLLGRMTVLFLLDPLKKKYELKNIRRADTFGLIATVTVNGKNLADMLIAEGLGRKATVNTFASDPIKPPTKTNTSITAGTFVASKSSKIFHTSTCRFAKSMDEAKKLTFDNRQAAINSGRRPCKTCKP